MFSRKQTDRSTLQDLHFLFSAEDLLPAFCPGDTLTHTSHSPHQVSLIVIFWMENYLNLAEKAA